MSKSNKKHITVALNLLQKKKIRNIKKKTKMKHQKESDTLNSPKHTEVVVVDTSNEYHYVASVNHITSAEAEHNAENCSVQNEEPSPSENTECIEGEYRGENSNLVEAEDHSDSFSIQNVRSLNQSVCDNASAQVVGSLNNIRNDKSDDLTHDENTDERLQAECCDDTSDIQDSELDRHNKLYTKKGHLRKRKLFEESKSDRKKKKLEEKGMKFNVKPPCDKKCRIKCTENISKDVREKINNEYWKMDEYSQRMFLSSCAKKMPVDRRTTTAEKSKRNSSFKYTLKNLDGEEIIVCKTFLLTTLGYNASNDRMLKNLRTSDTNLITPKKDMRGKHRKTELIDRTLIIEHIKSFRPIISHYRREHAPNRLYLPADVNINLMYNDFKEKYPTFNISYELYRVEVAKLNISFTKLGHEECYECEEFHAHLKSSGHTKDNLKEDCTECCSYNAHKEKYDAARAQYAEDKKAHTPGKIVISADLQKIIMLPRADMFKELLFLPRIVAYNESFVPAGVYLETFKTFAGIWHEAISGRLKEDIISTFYALFLYYRDIYDITIWLDNCSAQNKNWALFCFFIYIVNCENVNVRNIDIKYFEPGHTFMSADSFHHQVELSLKRQAKTFDFDDFKSAVQKSNSSKVYVKEMQVNDFFEWKDCSSKYKLKKLNPKPYLRNMVHVNFKRGHKVLYYKNTFSEEFILLNFLTAQCYKKGIDKPATKKQCNGITEEKKSGLISKLQSILPPNRMQFWNNIEVSNSNEEINYDLEDSVEE